MPSPLAASQVKREVEFSAISPTLSNFPIAVDWGPSPAIFSVQYFSAGTSGSTIVFTDARSGARSGSIGGSSFALSPNGARLARVVGGQGEGSQPNLQVLNFATLLDRNAAGRAQAPPAQYAPSLNLAWSRDGRYIALGYPIQPETRSVSQSMLPYHDTRVVELIRASPWERERARIDIFLSSDTAHPIASVDVNGTLYGLDWGAGQTLFYSSGQERPAPPARVRPAVLYRWTIQDGAPQQLFATPGRMLDMHPLVSPDGKWVALAADVDNRNFWFFRSILAVDAANGAVRRLTTNVPASGEYVWSADSRGIFFTARNGGFDSIMQVNLGGDIAVILSGPRRHHDIHISRDGEDLIYQTEDGYGRHDVRALSIASGRERILEIFADPAREFRLGRFSQVWWTNDRGARIAGFLVFPPDFDRRRRYPLFVDIHGSGAGSWLYLTAPFSAGYAPGPLEWHSWAAHGFVVFVPDYRSTGSYGEELVARSFADGDFGGIAGDTEDISSGIDFVATMSFINPRRICALGHSAGGPRLIRLLRRRPLAAAILHDAVPGAAVETMMYSGTGRQTGEPFLELSERLSGGRYDHAPDRFSQTDLLAGFEITTPTLIMVGNVERGAQPAPGTEFLFSSLLERGVPTRFLRFLDAGHTFPDPASASVAFTEAMNWCNRFISNDAGSL